MNPEASFFDVVLLSGIGPFVKWIAVGMVLCVIGMALSGGPAEDSRPHSMAGH